MKNNLKLQILSGLFVSLLIGMNLLGGKITNLFGISVSVAIFMAPLTFLITDIIEEVHGKKAVQNLLITSVISLVIIFLYTFLFINLEPHQRYGFDKEYKTIFTSSLRIIIASIIAFILAQTHDVWAFEFWKKKANGKALWLRNNLSTIVSQAIDTFIFMLVAFWQVSPKFTLIFIIQLAIPYYLFKVLFALIDTPFVYLGVNWLKDKSKTKNNQD